MTPQQQLQAFLIDEIGLEAAKRMVSEWKELGVDLSDGNTIKQLAGKEELMVSMSMLSNLGFLAKILYIKKQLKD